MFARKYLVWAGVSLLTIVLAAQPASGGAKTEFSGSDQVVGLLSAGTVRNADGNIIVRGLILQTRVTSSLFSGTMTMTMNGNLDSTYSGPVWGTFVLALDNNGGVWEGIWTGTRAMLSTSLWRATLRADGFGSGGAIEGMHIKVAEVADSTTPIPVPYTGSISGYIF